MFQMQTCLNILPFCCAYQLRYDTPPRRSARLQALQVGCTSDDVESEMLSLVRPAPLLATEPPAPPRPHSPHPQVHGNIQETLRELRDHLQLPRAEEHMNNSDQECNDSDQSELPYARDSSCNGSSDDEEGGYNNGPEVELEEIPIPPPELCHNPRWLPRRCPRNRATPNLNDPLPRTQRQRQEGNCKAGIDDRGKEGFPAARAGACTPGGARAGGGALAEGSLWTQTGPELPPNIWVVGGSGQEGEEVGVNSSPPVNGH
jgi:hypothetical protein